MAGVKGKSGGPRKNAGGARPGAGRKPKQPPAPEVAADVPPVVEVLEPLDYLLKVQNDPLSSPALRVRAAIAAAQYVHTKKGDGGKKDEQGDKAKKASAGKFAPAAPPLRVVGSR